MVPFLGLDGSCGSNRLHFYIARSLRVSYMVRRCSLFSLPIYPCCMSACFYYLVSSRHHHLLSERVPNCILMSYILSIHDSRLEEPDIQVRGFALCFRSRYATL